MMASDSRPVENVSSTTPTTTTTTTRRRRKTTRSRTGCRTCKIRHLKCDEAIPVCGNCARSGWTCEGPLQDVAAANASSLTSKRKSYPRGQRLSPLLRLSPTLPALALRDTETIHFDLFRHVLARRLFGDLGPRSWETLLLRTVHAEPCALYMALAVAAIVRRGGPCEVDYVLARQLYGKSLARLRGLMLESSTEALQAALVCSILVILFDLVEGNYQLAKDHLDKVLGVLTAQRGSVTIDTGLVDAFRHFDIQASSYVAKRAPLLLTGCLGDHSDGDDGGGGSDSEAIYRRLSVAIHATWNFVRLGESYGHLDGYPLPINDRIRSAQQRLQSELQHCTEALISLRPSVQDPRDLDRHRTFEIHARFCQIPLLCILETNETIYDAHEASFAQIVDLARAHLSRRSSSAGTSSSVKDVSLGLGVIQPLFFTALKCRTLTLRRKALALMREMRCSEGPWESESAWAIATAVVDLETTGLGGRGGTSNVATVSVPETRRIHHVYTDVNPVSCSAMFWCYSLPEGLEGGWQEFAMQIAWGDQRPVEKV